MDYRSLSTKLDATASGCDPARARLAGRGGLVVIYEFGRISIDRRCHTLGSAQSAPEAHDPETHVIPLAIAAAVNGTAFRIFGTDYDTPDGTAVRDFVHVDDLADAHLRALGYLSQGGSSDAFNLGAGTGASVLDVLREVEIAVGKPVATAPEPRRPGDAPQLISNWARAESQLGWRPNRSGLDNIVSSAWHWHRSTTIGQDKE
jgi:UDP-glucose 4-epimerase